MPPRVSSKPRYSAWRLFREGLTGQSGWRPAWTPRRPAPRYDAVIIGGGGHGLSTAYHLAKRHAITSIAVLEKGWIGGGNTGRNTTVVRSNYYYPQSVRLYDLSVQLYEGLSKELNYNVMFSQRGMLELVHGKGDLEIALRIANAMRVNGIDGTVIGRDEIARMAPALDMDFNRRWPVVAALLQPRAGVARHDAVAWGYARAADSLGVHIIENCEVTGFQISGRQVRAVETTLGPIATEKVGVAVAGHSSVLAAMAGFELPLQSYTLQAMVSEPLKPCLDTVVASFGIGTYVSQSDKGELVIGGGLDRAPSYAQRGNLPMTRQVLAGILEMFPAFANLKLMRQWGGIVDVAPDSSPILGPSPIGGLYLNCGWGTGGFKAIPAGGYLLAHIMATGRHHDISEPFDLSRFTKGELIDEAAGAGIAH